MRLSRAGRPRKGRERAHLNLAPDVLSRLDALAEQRAQSRNDVAEDLLRGALDAAEHAAHQLPDFSLHT